MIVKAINTILEEGGHTHRTRIDRNRDDQIQARSRTQRRNGPRVCSAVIRAGIRCSTHESHVGRKEFLHDDVVGRTRTLVRNSDRIVDVGPWFRGQIGGRLLEFEIDLGIEFCGHTVFVVLGRGMYSVARGRIDVILGSVGHFGAVRDGRICLRCGEGQCLGRARGQVSDGPRDGWIGEIRCRT